MISRVFIIAIASFVGLLVFVAVLLRPLPTGENSERRRRWWKIFRVAMVVILISIAASAVWAFFIEPDRLVVRYETIRIESWPNELSGIRIAIIGDIHTDGLLRPL